MQLQVHHLMTGLMSKLPYVISKIPTPKVPKVYKLSHALVKFRYTSKGKQDKSANSANFELTFSKAYELSLTKQQSMCKTFVFAINLARAHKTRPQLAMEGALFCSPARLQASI